MPSLNKCLARTSQYLKQSVATVLVKCVQIYQALKTLQQVLRMKTLQSIKIFLNLLEFAL